MRKTILTILGAAVFVGSTVQIAAASEHHKYRKVYREPAPFAEPYRGAYDNSNAHYGDGWPGPYAESNRSRYENGAGSAPAGH
jgi:hypothetical protein